MQKYIGLIELLSVTDVDSPEGEASGCVVVSNIFVAGVSDLTRLLPFYCPIQEPLESGSILL